MRLRIKTPGFLGAKRNDYRIKIDHIDVKEDLMSPEKSITHILFKGRDCSGILNLSQEEAKKLIDTLRPILGLIKGSKIIKD
jgi:hypothetical protein